MRWLILYYGFFCCFFSGQLVFCILSVIPKTKEYFQIALRAYVGCFSEKGIITSVIGAFMLGVGMTLAGAVSNFNVNDYTPVPKKYSILWKPMGDIFTYD